METRLPGEGAPQPEVPSTAAQEYLERIESGFGAISVEEILGRTARGELTEKETRGILAELVRREREGRLTDDLTGLRNRKYYNLHAPEIVNRLAKGEFAHRTFVHADLDKLKQINDATQDHRRGDEALIRFSEVLFSTLGPQAELIVRHGGDEFRAVLRTDERETGVLLQQLRKELEGVFVEGFPVQGSYGTVTVRSGEQVTLDEIEQHAEQGMYGEKTGK